MIGRRQFLSLLGGAAGLPLAAHAQQAAVPVIGYLDTGSPGLMANFVAAFHKGLDEAGYVEGQSVAIEYRWANDRLDRLPALAADLVLRRVSVLVASGGPSAQAARAATATIPIVFQMGPDPVKLGLVASMNRPGGNVTGINNITAGLSAKRLGLLHELVPGALTIAVLINPAGVNFETTTRDLQEAARALGLHLIFLNVSGDDDFEPAFASLVHQGAGALLLPDSTIFNSRREQLVALAARHAIPTIYTFPEFAAAGGLMSYATSLTESYRQAGVYAARILKGAKPGDLPVLQPTKFELVINLKTAKALGLTVPASLLATADEVIE
jgi:putative ABC transport system substrate-binding protein